MKDDQSVVNMVLVTNAHKQEVFELLEEFQPRIRMDRAIHSSVRVLATANHKDLHMLFEE